MTEAFVINMPIYCDEHCCKSRMLQKQECDLDFITNIPIYCDGMGHCCKSRVLQIQECDWGVCNKYAYIFVMW